MTPIVGQMSYYEQFIVSNIIFFLYTPYLEFYLSHNCEIYKIPNADSRTVKCKDEIVKSASKTEKFTYHMSYL